MNLNKAQTGHNFWLPIKLYQAWFYLYILLFEKRSLFNFSQFFNKHDHFWSSLMDERGQNVKIHQFLIRGGFLVEYPWDEQFKIPGIKIPRFSKIWILGNKLPSLSQIWFLMLKGPGNKKFPTFSDPQVFLIQIVE